MGTWHVLTKTRGQRPLPPPPPLSKRLGSLRLQHGLLSVLNLHFVKHPERERENHTHPVLRDEVVAAAHILYLLISLRFFLCEAKSCGEEEWVGMRLKSGVRFSTPLWRRYVCMYLWDCYSSSLWSRFVSFPPLFFVLPFVIRFRFVASLFSFFFTPSRSFSIEMMIVESIGFRSS